MARQKLGAGDKYLVTGWVPETAGFWQCTGKATANRNLWISALALLLAFAVWMVWSVLVLKLPGAGFRYSTNQLFWLAALPGLSGATLRIGYAFMLPLFGARRWTAISTAVLLVPALGIGFALQDPGTGYPTMLALALLCGLGGANFASSMANIGAFYPASHRTFALGLNAGIGNLGIAAVQLAVPLAVGSAVFGAAGGAPQDWIGSGIANRVWLQNAGFIWVPAILLASALAWFGMNDLALARVPFAEQSVIFRRKHNWIMCWLGLGTFGSFIGYAAAFPLLAATAFPAVDPLAQAFLGPLAGALARIAGARVAGRVKGSRLALASYCLMTCAVLGVLLFLPRTGVPGNFNGFFAMSVLLFAAAGLGSAATSGMVPAIFLAERAKAALQRGRAAREAAALQGATEGSAVLGFTSAVAAYGAFFVPKSFGASIALTGSAHAALSCFIGFYASCAAIAWWFYARRNAAIAC